MPKNLLLADDSITIQKVVGITFANEDYQVTAVDNGEDAVAKAKELRPDVILADVVMPKRNGYEVCEAVKSDPGLAHIPVLLLAGTFEAFDEARARAAKADGHIAKPFESQALINKVRELVEGKGAVQAQPAARPAPAAPAPAPRPQGPTPAARPAAPAPGAPAARPAAPGPAPAQARPPAPGAPPRPGAPAPAARPPGAAPFPQGAMPPGARPPAPGMPPAARPPPGAPPAAARPPASGAVPGRPGAPAPVPGARPAAPGMAPQARPPAPVPARPAPQGPARPAAAAAPAPAAPAPRKDPFGFGVAPAARPAAPAPAAPQRPQAVPAPAPAPARPPEDDWSDVEMTDPGRALSPEASAAFDGGLSLDLDAAVAPPAPIELPPPGGEEPELAPMHAFVPPAAATGHKPEPAAPARADGGEAALRAALSSASREVIERVVWEVVPELAETIIRENLDRLVKTQKR
jgi:CheY-like chemotaxis protein